MSSRLAPMLVALATLAGSAAPAVLHAEAIEFWKADAVTDAHDIRIEDGILYYSSKGAAQQVKLADVKNVGTSLHEKITMPVFQFATVDRQPGRRLGFVITDPDRKRFPEPLIRVFLCSSDDKGKRDVQLYLNRKSADVTSIADAPEVSTDSYATRYYFIPVQHEVAWHFEVWTDGERRFYFDRKPDDFPADWWQTAPIRSSNLLRETKAPVTDTKVAKASDDGEKPPPVAVTITGARVHPAINPKDASTFVLNYSLDSRYLEEVDLPKGTIYFLTEDADGQRTVRKASIEPEAGSKKTLQAFKTTRECEIKLPSTITSGPELGTGAEIVTVVKSTTDRSTGKTTTKTTVDKGGERLLYWRVELNYGTNVMAIKESPNQGIGGTLPENWWK